MVPTQDARHGAGIHVSLLHTLEQTSPKMHESPSDGRLTPTPPRSAVTSEHSQDSAEPTNASIGESSRLAQDLDAAADGTLTADHGQESWGDPNDVRHLPDASSLSNRQNRSAEVGHRELQVRDEARYDVVAEHGRGGLGRVLHARDRDLDRDVAIKEMLSCTGSSEARFVREAMLTAKLQHPNIVPIHEAGRWPDGRPFYTMKLVRGRSFKECINSCETLEDRLTLLGHLVAVADAIAYAHSKHIIHRDLKPANVIIGGFGETVVIDWGLAKDLSETVVNEVEEGPYRALHNEQLTAIGSVLGTPAYMSPEQALGEEVDERTDVYALGAMLYQLIVGQLPPTQFDSESPSGATRIAGVEELLAEVPQDAPSDLVAILHSALESADRRYRDATEFARDLRQYKNGGLVAAHTYTLREKIGKWFDSHPGSRRFVLAGLALLLVAGAYSAMQQRAANRSVVAANAKVTKSYAAVEAEKQALTLAVARSELSTDPTKTLSWLRRWRGTDKNAAVVLAVEARARGVSTEVSHNHQDTVISMLCFPDGSRATTGEDDAIILVPHGAAGSIIHTGVGEFGLLAQFSSDSLIFDTSDNRVIGYDTRLGRKRTIARNTGTLTTLAADVDRNRILYANSLGAFVAVDLDSGKSQKLAQSVAFEPYRVRPVIIPSTSTYIHIVDGKLHFVSPGRRMPTKCPTGITTLDARASHAFVGTESGDVYTIDTSSIRPECRRISSQPFKIDQLRVSQSGQLLAFSDASGLVHLRDMRTGEVATFASTAAALLSISEDGRFVATAGSTGQLVLFDWKARVRRELLGHWVPLSAPAVFCGNNTLLSGDDLGFVRKWSLDGPSSRVLHRHDERVNHVVVTSDGAVVSDGADGTVVMSDVNLRTSQVVISADENFYGVAWNKRKSTVAAASVEGDIWLADQRDARKILSVGGLVVGLAFDDMGENLYTLGLSGRLIKYSLANRTSQEIEIGASVANGLVMSPRSAYISSPGGQVIVVDLNTLETSRPPVVSPADNIQGLAYSPDTNRVASVAWTGEVKIWNADSPDGRSELFVPCATNESTVESFVLSADGRNVALGFRDGRVCYRFRGHDHILSLYRDWPRSLRMFTAKEPLLLIGTDAGRLIVVALRDGRTAVASLSERSISDIGVIDGGHSVVTSSADGYVRRTSLDGFDFH